MKSTESVTDIESRFRQGPEIVICFPDFGELLPISTNIFHRTDYHEDGSKSEYYGIELSKEQYKLLKKIIVHS